MINPQQRLSSIENTESISSKIRNKTRVSTLTVGMVLIPVSCTMSRTSFQSSSCILSIRSRPLNLFLTLTTTIQHRFGNSSHSNLRRTRNKMNPDWRRHDPIHRKPKDTTRNYQSQSVNIVKLQDIKLIHRSPLDSYRLTMRKQKEKLRKQFHSPLK